MKISMAIIIVLLIVSSKSYSQETLETTINAYAPEGHHFQGHNKYSSLATFNGNIYVFSMDNLRRPYINKIDETDSDNIETALIDTNETDIYRVFDDAHHRFAIGIDQLGYIHVIGDMHHGNLGSKRDVSVDNPLPERFNGSIGGQMYWVSDSPEDISSFSFVGFDSLRAIPCNGLTYAHIEPDLNGKLYMAGRQSVRAPRQHIPGTMGLSLWRYDITKNSWEELQLTIMTLQIKMLFFQALFGNLTDTAEKRCGIKDILIVLNLTTITDYTFSVLLMLMTLMMVQHMFYMPILTMVEYLCPKDFQMIFMESILVFFGMKISIPDFSINKFKL